MADNEAHENLDAAASKGLQELQQLQALMKRCLQVRCHA
jgi:hypothetical protein